MKLKNKVALISGGSRGIGRSIALAFAEEGADVILVARNREHLKNVAAKITETGKQALPISCDVSSVQQVQELATEVQKSFDHIDILVNNAGVSKRSKFLDYDDETWFEVIRINLFGVYLCTKAFLPMMPEGSPGSPSISVAGVYFIRN